MPNRDADARRRINLARNDRRRSDARSRSGQRPPLRAGQAGRGGSRHVGRSGHSSHTLYLVRGGRRRLGMRHLALIVGATALLLIAVLAGRALLGGAAPDEKPQHVQIAATEALGMPTTPEKLWGAGGVPYLYQTDERWASKPYAEDTIEISGCGPTCLSMVYMGLTGKADMTPVEMAKFSEENGYVEAGMTAWNLFSQGAAALGLNVHGVGINPDEVKAALDGGEILVLSMNPGDFTTVGHFMVVAGIDESNRLIVHDPNSPQNSLLRWPMLQILSQAANIWAFS